MFENAKLFIEKLAYAGHLEIAENFDLPDAVTIVLPEATVYIPMDELIDKKAELIRLQKELDDSKKQLEQTKSKLDNVGFMSKAPASVVENVKRNYNTLKDKIESLESAILELK